MGKTQIRCALLFLNKKLRFFSVIPAKLKTKKMPDDTLRQKLTTDLFLWLSGRVQRVLEPCLQ